MSSPATAPQRLTTVVSPYLRDMLIENRERAHTHVMSAFPRATNDESPRSELGVLWHLDHALALLTVQSRVPALQPGLLGDVRSVSNVDTPAAGTRVRVRLFTNLQKTPPARLSPELARMVKEQSGRAYRSQMVIVPEEERSIWAVRRLERAGLRADLATVVVGRVAPARLRGRGQSIPAAEITAEAVVENAELLAKAIGSGIGKGKNYGLGLLHLETIATAE
jgi:hypothetical protein